MTITHYSVEATFRGDKVDKILASSRNVSGRNHSRSFDPKNFYDSCVHGTYVGKSEKEFFAIASEHGFVLTGTSLSPSTERSPYQWTVRIFRIRTAGSELPNYVYEKVYS